MFDALADAVENIIGVLRQLPEENQSDYALAGPGGKDSE